MVIIKDLLELENLLRIHLNNKKESNPKSKLKFIMQFIKIGYDLGKRGRMEVEVLEDDIIFK